jgi:hypothetical protein
MGDVVAQIEPETRLYHPDCDHLHYIQLASLKLLYMLSQYWRLRTGHATQDSFRFPDQERLERGSISHPYLDLFT